MSILFRKSEQRAISYQDVWGAGGDPALRGDSIQNALQIAAVYAATSLIADQFASTPWAAFEKSGEVPEKMRVQPRLLTDPGNGVDLYSWKHQAIASCLLRGNSYGLILDVDNAGVPSAVQWLHPDHVQIDDTTGQYYWNGRHVPRDQVIHIPGYVLPGSKKGLSPLALFKLQIETGMEAQRFGKKFFKRGTTPPSILKYLRAGLTTEQAQTAKERFDASVSSSSPFVTGNDWDYTAITVPPGEAQFLAGIKATANQIAAVYRVDPSDVGGESGGSTLKYETLELNQLNFAVRTLRPWATRFETVFSRYLSESRYVKFNLDAGVRADLKSRYEAHQIALTAGFRTVDEVRVLEELPPLTGPQDSAAAARAVAELVQKIYLGVGTVLSSDEARTIANRAGAELNGSLTTGVTE